MYKNMPSSINKQSVDTTLPKAIYKWVTTRDKMLKIMEAGDDSPLPAENEIDILTGKTVELATTKLGRLPQLVKDLRDAENKIFDVKVRIKDRNIKEGETQYVEEQYNSFLVVCNFANLSSTHNKFIVPEWFLTNVGINAADMAVELEEFYYDKKLLEFFKLTRKEETNNTS